MKPHGDDVKPGMHSIRFLAIFAFVFPASPSLSRESCVAVQGHYAYISGADLEILDITSPQAPFVIGRVAVGGATRDIAVDGTIALVGSNLGLGTVDVSNPSYPQLLSGVTGVGTPFGVALRGTTGYCVNGGGGSLLIIDLSDPAQPYVQSTLLTGGYPRKVCLHEDHAYVVDDGGLRIVDIADPENPSIVGQVTIGGAYGVAVVYPMAYVAVWNYGLRVVDVSSSTSPVIVGNLPLSASGPGSAWDVAVFGTLARVIVGGQLYNVNVSDPANPTLLAGLTAPPVEDVTASSVYSYIATWITNFHIVDNSNPAAPILLRSEIDPIAYAVAPIDDQHVAAVGWQEGFLVTDVSIPLAPRYVGSLEQSCLAVAIAGPWAYIGGFDTLHIADISTPISPVVVGSFPGVNLSSLTAHGDLLFANQAGTNPHWLEFDVSSPSSPTIVASLAIPEGTCAASGSFVYHVASAYPAGADDGLRVIDVSNPGDPTIISYLIEGRGRDVALDSTLAYVGKSNGLTIVDVADPGAPTIISGLTTQEGVRFVDLLMPYAYLSVYSYGIDIIDVSDPYAPSQVGTIDLPREASLGVVFVPPYAYVAGGTSFQVLDISDPTAPVLMGQIVTTVELSRFTATPNADGVLVEWDTSFELRHLGFRLLRRTQDEEYRLLTPSLIPPPGPYEFLDRDVIPNLGYEYLLEAIDRQGGIERFGPIAVRAPGTTILRVESWPNPLSAADLPVQIRADIPVAGVLGLDVFDVSGRLVRNLWEGRLASGRRTFQWDGRDARGGLVPSGVYFYRLASPGHTAQASIVLVR